MESKDDMYYFKVIKSSKEKRVMYTYYVYKDGSIKISGSLYGSIIEVRLEICDRLGIGEENLKLSSEYEKKSGNKEIGGPNKCIICGANTSRFRYCSTECQKIGVRKYNTEYVAKKRRVVIRGINQI